nr:arf-GAP domain and FG repeat-containing protein 1 [Onthophagus taurus]
MASTRKKQDEKNLKTLRDLVSLPHNKYCFDCNQRGPTYVNVTIGSFVCTKCSGILRGLTPPHRVKSISMATFTPEEIELMQQKGNEYCRRTWLGLYEGQPLTEGAPRDEQHVHDLMVEKYERRRYYVEPATAATLANGGGSSQRVKPSTLNSSSSSFVSESKPIRLNGMVAEKNEKNLLPRPNGISRPIVNGNGVNNNNGFVGIVALGKQEQFVANFDQADIFNATNNNVISNGKRFLEDQQHYQQQQPQQPSFANFENNPVFNTPASMPELPARNPQKSNSLLPPAPPEDRYLPLKDLDNALKNQATIDWNSGSSNGSGYNSSTPSGSVYSSSSPQSMYGSPSQSQFSNMFPQEQPQAPISNPFNTNSQKGGNVWGSSNGFTNGTNANPFRGTPTVDPFLDPFKGNGFSQGFQAFSAPFNGQAWTPNPFKVATNGHSNNPFL